jgi:H+/gluconate symporter-like permease
MSGLTEQIIATAAVITAITVIITTIIAAYKFIRKWDKWREEKDQHDKENYKAILRLVIMTPEMPLSERIEAGDTYVNKLNGNGGVKQKYKELLQRFAEEHKE